MTRGMVYSGRVNEALTQARTLDPRQPAPLPGAGQRPVLPPKMFGGGPDKAKPLYEKAQALFAAFQPASALSPTGAGNATPCWPKSTPPWLPISNGCSAGIAAAGFLFLVPRFWLLVHSC